MVKDLLQELVELLKEQQREKWIEELKTKYSWCGIHNKAMVGSTPQYSYNQLMAQQNTAGYLGSAIGGTLGGLVPSANTVSTYVTYGAPYVCPDCAQAGKERKDDLLRKLGHKW